MTRSFFAFFIVFTLATTIANSKSFLQSGSTVVYGGGCCSDYQKLILAGFSCIDDCGIAFGGDDYVLDQYAILPDNLELYYKDNAGGEIYLRDLNVGASGLVSAIPFSWSVSDTTQWVETEAFFFSDGDSVMVIHKLYSGNINEHYDPATPSSSVMDVITVKESVNDVVNSGGGPAPSSNSITNTIEEHQKSLESLIEAEVFPQPVENSMNIVLPPRYAGTTNEVRFIDVSGKTARTITFQGTACKLDVSQLDTGVYLLKVLSSDGTIAMESKVLKQ